MDGRLLDGLFLVYIYNAWVAMSVFYSFLSGPGVTATERFANGYDLA